MKSHQAIWAAEWRHRYLQAAIEAGKNAFVIPPVAVDGPGVRSVVATAELARQKGLGILVGYQRHFQPNYRETIRRLQDGAIGPIQFCEDFCNYGGIRLLQPRRSGWSDMEWQLRNWLYFTWLSGDCFVNLHSAHLDVINWPLASHPLRAFGLGGRQANTGADTGDVYDHFSVEYEYAKGVQLFSQCRTMDGCSGRLGERATGADGTSNCMNVISGRNAWRLTDHFPNPYAQEHAEFIRSIREGRPLNNAIAAAESALTAIMGREAAYSGQDITWEAALNSTRRLGPDHYELGAVPTTEIPLPGRYRFE
jgi:predicted dehydrogenase